MGDNRIAGIGSGMTPQVSSVDIDKRQKEATEVMFSDMLSMGTGMQENGFAEYVTDDVAATSDVSAVNTRKEKPVDAYEKYQYKDKTIRKENNGVTSETTDKVVAEVEDFEEAVTEVIEEELHVTKEEIEAAMEELGLTYIDLLHNGNLAKLAAKLTGCEGVNQLLCNESFVNVMQQVSELGKALLQDVKMTSAELAQLHSGLDVPKFEDKGMRDVAILPVEESVNEFTDGTEPGLNTEIGTETDAEEVLGVVSKTEVNAETELDADVKGLESDIKLEVIESENANEQNLEQGMSDNAEAGHADAKEQSSQNIKTGHGHSVLNNEVAGLQGVSMSDFYEGLSQVESTQTLPPQVSVADIMEQFVEQTRIFTAMDTTKFEMQLNPEHLGKLYVEITETEGSIQAKIQTQNLVVKEAIELQIADLKMNLSQVGVKVDSVEVTVASHEFERNLEQDANSQKQQENAQPKGNRHRNINLNSLDELSGLMTEEETLVAKMMAEQGNSVDFTA